MAVEEEAECQALVSELFETSLSAPPLSELGRVSGSFAWLVCVIDGIFGNEARLRHATALADWGCVSHTGTVVSGV